MDKLSRQDRSPEVRRLRELLRRSPPALPDVDWHAAEKEVFSKLDRDAMAQPGRVGKPWHRRLMDAVIGWTSAPAPVLVAAAACVCIAAGLFFLRRPAAVPGTPVEILHANGSAKVSPASTGLDRSAQPGRAGLPAVGEVFRTGADGMLVVRTEPGTGFGLGASSQLKVAQADPSCQRYVLDTGSVSLIVKKRSDARCLEVVTPNALCRVLGTVFRVDAQELVDGRPVTRLTVMRGAVRIQSRARPDRFTVVHAGQQVVVVGDTLDVPVPVRMPLAPEDVADSLLDRELRQVLSPALSLACPDLAAVTRVAGPLFVPSAAAFESAAAPGAMPFDLGPKSGPAADETIRLAAARELDTRVTARAGVTVANTWTLSDTNSVAGILVGIPLYWERVKPVPDTIGFAEACAAFLSLPPGKYRSPGALPAVAAEGKRFIAVKEPNALSLAILNDLGVGVLFLSQWSGIVQTRGHSSSRSDTGYVRENLVSDYLWERIDSVTVGRPRGVQTDYQVRMHVFPAGVSDFAGRDNLRLATRQIMGTTGLSLRDKSRQDIPEQNLRRVIIAVYCIADAGTTAADLSRRVEAAMDRMKLDLSYRPPEFRELRLP